MENLKSIKVNNDGTISSVYLGIDQDLAPFKLIKHSVTFEYLDWYSCIGKESHQWDWTNVPQ